MELDLGNMLGVNVGTNLNKQEILTHKTNDVSNISSGNKEEQVKNNTEIKENQDYLTLQKDFEGFKQMQINSALIHKKEVAKLKNEITQQKPKQKEIFTTKVLEDPDGFTQQFQETITGLNQRIDKLSTDLPKQVNESILRDNFNNYDEFINQANALMAVDMNFKNEMQLSSNPQLLACNKFSAENKLSEQKKFINSQNEDKLDLNSSMNNYSTKTKGSKRRLTNEERQMGIAYGFTKETEEEYLKHIIMMENLKGG